MIRALLSGGVTSIGMFPARDICLHSNYWFDSRRLHLIVERDRAIKVTVIGDCYGSSAQLLCALRQRLYLYGPVKKTEVRVKMEVYEVFFVHCFFLCDFNDRFLGAAGVTSLRSERSG